MGWAYGTVLKVGKEFIRYLQGKQNCKITEVHVHHTYSPNHSHFTGNNHRELQDGMKRYHMKNRGWSDIGQHITIFPDGKIVTGRNINTPPASATKYNDSDADHKHPFMFEMVGNFDKGHDNLTGKQLQSVLDVTRYFYNKGAIIRFHREMADKSCPGSGISKTWFVNMVKSGSSSSPKLEPYDNNAEYHRLLYLKEPMLRGEDVKRVQKRLKTKIIDGIYGSATQADVKMWQSLHDEKGRVVPKGKGLVVDGIVGEKTWGALFLKAKP